MMTNVTEHIKDLYRKLDEPTQALFRVLAEEAINQLETFKGDIDPCLPSIEFVDGEEEEIIDSLQTDLFKMREHFEPLGEGLRIMPLRIENQRIIVAFPKKLVEILAGLYDERSDKWHI